MPILSKSGSKNYSGLSGFAVYLGPSSWRHHAIDDERQVNTSTGWNSDSYLDTIDEHELQPVTYLQNDLLLQREGDGLNHFYING